MKNQIPLPVKAIVGVLLLIIISYSVFFFIQSTAVTAITASGSVEAVEVSISPEVNGKVVEVSRDLGQTVAAGDKLFGLDGAVMLAQQKLAKSNLESVMAGEETAKQAVALAQLQYDTAADTANSDDIKLRTENWSGSNPSEFDQPGWYFSLDEEFKVLLDSEASAKTDVETAKTNLTSVEERSAGQEFLSAENRLAAARVGFVIAQDVVDQVGDASDGTEMNTEADSNFEDAKTELADAQKEYADAMSTEGAQDILDARAKYQVAQTRVDAVQAKILTYKTGDRSTKFKLAEVTLAQATSQHNQAALAVQVAAANLELIDAQVAKLVVNSPINGVVQMRNVEVGEVVNPGTIVFNIIDLSQLSLTVFIAEDRYGEISLGQRVEVTADSFDGQIFEGTVVQISDKAEFTPRNVQTSDGRKTTVFAIKIQISDPEGKLKPGMPADVKFIVE